MRKLNNNNKEVSIVTVTLECEGGKASENNCRYEILKKVVAKYGKKDIILFSGGFFTVSAFGSEEETKTVNDVSRLLKDINSDTVVCLGIDGFVHNEQIAIAIDKSGICAKGLKFNPAPNERKGIIKLAKSFNCKESGYDRIFECKGKRFYLAVCYDIFGIKKLKRKAKPETDDVKIDAILNTVHFFYPFGKEGSGYPNFIRHGFGGASFRWNCPVFGAAVFFERKVPDDWQSGFFCKRREQIQQDIRYIAYSDNLLEQNRQDCDISTGYETAVCYLYTI